MKRVSKLDKTLILILAALIVGGLMIFASAAFGLLARGSTHMSSVVFSHVVLGVGLGIVGLIIGAIIPYRTWRPYAVYLFGFALVLTTAVFLPGIGFEHGGGRSWIIIGNVSFQPSEVLKLATIIMAAAYFSGIKNKISTMKYGLGGFLAVLAGPVLVLLMQPDIGTLSIICLSIFAMYIVAGASLRDIVIVMLLGVLAVGVLFAIKPHIRERVMTFMYPSQGQQDQAYQIKQSLIAVGSGGFAGRGFGQGIQKFTYLPEPMGDSIFAVAAEELGFIGSVVIVFLFASLALRGYSIGTHAPDVFGALVAIGIASYFTIEAFINISAMLGMAPITGVPLTFISQGGSAMLAALVSAGILLNISRYRVRHAN